MRKHLGVSFVYEDEPQAIPSVAPPDGSSFAPLPADLVNGLESALIQLDAVAVHGAIDAIGAYDPALSRSLAALAGDFQYDTILRLIRGEEGAVADDTGASDGRR
jgi:hypothetical protein